MLARLSPLIAALVLVGGCKKPAEGPAAEKKAPQAAPVKVPLVVASLAATPEILTLTGLVAADQRSEVTADTAGKVIGVMVERGQRVKMGDPVVRLDVRNAALSGREANANLENARAQKTLAEQECARAKGLFDKGAITRSEFDRQNTQCISALQQVTAAQARTEMIAKSVNDGVVRAPFDGEVAEKSVAPGEWVAPGRALFTLVDDDPLRIELSVPEVAITSIKKDQKVKLTAVARPGVEYSATVTRVGAEIGRTRSLIVEATIDIGGAVLKAPLGSAVGAGTGSAAAATGAEKAPDLGTGSAGSAAGSAAGSGSAAKTGSGAATPKPGTPGKAGTEARPTTATTQDATIEPLVPGMFAEARVTVGQKQRPVLPATAVVLRGKTYHAFVVVKGVVEERIVQLGPEPAPGQVSISLGIEAGDKVVAAITDQIIDGLKVVE